MSLADPSWNIQNVSDTTAPGCEQVCLWLREYNLASNPEFMRLWEMPENEKVPLVLLASSEAAVVGGLFAETQFAWLRISIMAVDPGSRGKGAGSALLNEAERQGALRGCRYAYVDTMSYQAPGFYLKHGYQIVG